MRALHRGAAVVAAVLTAGLVSAPATAAPDEPDVIAKKLLTPLSLAVADDGTVYVSQNFAGVLMRGEAGTKPTPVWSAKKGTEVGALAAVEGGVRFATTKGARAALWELADGATKPTQLADLAAYEAKKNPDRKVSYGFESIDPACAAQVPEEVPISYTGIVESHPYGSAVKGSTTYVADAAGNAILAVTNGKVSTVAVLPPVPVTITAEAAAANGLPACTVGLTYRFEPVPTDVEIGPKGTLYVSGLPGGPEDGSTGAQGRVWTVKPSSGKVKLLADGLLSATGLAVDAKGTVYVAQLFAGQVSRIKAGSSTAKPYVTTPLPGAVEWGSDKTLYVTANVMTGLSGEPGDKPKGTVLVYGR